MVDKFTENSALVDSAGTQLNPKIAPICQLPPPAEAREEKP